MVYCLFSIACGPNVTHRQIDPAFTNLFIRFVSEGAQRSAKFDSGLLDNIIIVFDDLPYSSGGSVVGYCEESRRLVRIDRLFWNELNRSGWIKEALLFHELGHCILNRSHTTKTIQGGAPGSLMFPDVLSEDIFNASTESLYLDELYAYQGT